MGIQLTPCNPCCTQLEPGVPQYKVLVDIDNSVIGATYAKAYDCTSGILSSGISGAGLTYESEDPNDPATPFNWEVWPYWGQPVNYLVGSLVFKGSGVPMDKSVYFRYREDLKRTFVDFGLLDNYYYVTLPLAPLRPSGIVLPAFYLTSSIGDIGGVRQFVYETDWNKTMKGGVDWLGIKSTFIDNVYGKLIVNVDETEYKTNGELFRSSDLSSFFSESGCVQFLSKPHKLWVTIISSGIPYTCYYETVEGLSVQQERSISFVGTTTYFEMFNYPTRFASSGYYYYRGIPNSFSQTGLIYNTFGFTNSFDSFPSRYYFKEFRPQSYWKGNFTSVIESGVDLPNISWSKSSFCFKVLGGSNLSRVNELEITI